MRVFAIPVFFCAFEAAAQTGPGGVGSSATNVLWLDANKGVTQSGGLVSQWNDRSGNNNHALQPGAIPTAKPAFVASSVNGYPSLDFDGTDDQLWVTDNATIDLTQWHFFMVLTTDVQKNYNAWMVKGDDSDENWEMLSYNDGNIHTPTKYTDGTRTFPSSVGGQVTTTTFDIIEYSYSTGVGRDVYKNATNIITDNENKTPKVNNLPLYIANERSTTGRCVDGDIAEVVAYNAPLNSAQRVIVNNYLAAKYNRTLSTNDLFIQDNAGNGNFDHDVAGIGRVDASNQQTDSRGSGIVQIGKAGYGGLDNNEFLLWGHNNGVLGTFGVPDKPAGVQGRWGRVWRVNEVSTGGTAVDVGNVDITFEMAGLGPVTASDLRLLVDSDNDGLFADDTPISGATFVSGSLYRFSNTSAIANGLRFTLGTTNVSNTPLPIELVSFTASPVDGTTVRLKWVTASEQGNDYFTVERSADTYEWIDAATLDGVGNSTELTDYTMDDRDLTQGTLYYRLRQTDLDGTSTVSDIVVVDLSGKGDQKPLVYPNPGSGPYTLNFSEPLSGRVDLQLIDPAGRKVALFSEAMAGTSTLEFDPLGIIPGLYQLRVCIGGKVSVNSLVITP
ncbi:MAG: hypothetical protein IPP33_01830 [Flavobacteriales bacterium]|nr:hypothetical protein [Flavobacteriales bacterium]